MLEENKNLPKTSKILEKITDNDKLVHLYDEAMKRLKSIKTNENILTYRNIVAKIEVTISHHFVVIWRNNSKILKIKHWEKVIQLC